MLSALLTAALAFPLTLEIALFLTGLLHLIRSILSFFAQPAGEISLADLGLAALAALLGAGILAFLVPMPLLTLYPFAGKIFAMKALSVLVGSLWIVRTSVALSSVREPQNETLRAFLTGAGAGLHSKTPLISVVVDGVRLAVYSTWALQANPMEVRGTGLALIAVAIGVSLAGGVFSHRYATNLRRIEALCLFAVSIAIVLGWTDR